MPGHEKAGETAKEQRDVRVRILVNRLVDIDIAKHTFTAHLKLEASWVEKDADLLKFVADGTAPGQFSQITQLSESTKEPLETNQEKGVLYVARNNSTGAKLDKPLYAPRLSFRNLVDTHSRVEWFKFYKPGSEEIIVCWRMKILGTFQEAMELKRFPYDKQSLTFEMVSDWELVSKDGLPRKDGNSTRLMSNLSANYSSRVNTKTFIYRTQYRLHPTLEYETSNTDSRDSIDGLRYSLLNASMKVERRPGYVLLNIVLPLFLITSCTFATYLVAKEDFPDRGAISVSVQIAQVAFKFVVADKVPNIGYATALDLYVLFCFGVSFAVLFHQSLVAANVVEEMLIAPYGIDYIGFVALCLWISTHVVAFLMRLAKRIPLAIEWMRKQLAGSKPLAVWVGPLRVIRDPQEAAREIAQIVAQIASVKCDGYVVACRVWQPEELDRLVPRIHEDHSGEDSNSQCAVIVFEEQTNESPEHADNRDTDASAALVAQAYQSMRKESDELHKTYLDLVRVCQQDPGSDESGDVKVEQLYVEWTALVERTLREGHVPTTPTPDKVSATV